MGLIGPIGHIKDGVIGTGDSWQLAGKDGSLLCLHDRGGERRNDPNRENQDGSVRSVVASGLAEGFGSFSEGTLSRRTAPAKRLSK